MFRLMLSLVLLVGVLPADPARAADPRITCRGPVAGHLGSDPVCASLAALLAGRDITLALELTRDEPLVLAGRLVWQVGGRSVAGPLVEVTASERPLDARAGARLARGLVQVSDLP